MEYLKNSKNFLQSASDKSIIVPEVKEKR